MKKELEDVYVRVEELKKIEGDREKLINEVNQSQLAKSDWNRQYENLKLEFLKIEAENKKQILEIKHYKNIANRIKSSNYSYD